MQDILYAGDTRISYYDLDMWGKLKLSALLRMAHIAADVNAASLGIGFNDLDRLSMTFVLQRIGFRFLRLPSYNDIVSIRTWPSEISKGTFLRRGDMKDANGQKLIEWASLWILFDLRERKILKPCKLPIEIPRLPDLGVDIMPIKIALPDRIGEMYSTHTHTVRYSDTDTNIHMNNSVYGDLVGNAVFPHEEKLDTDLDFGEVQINYLSEARLGVKINIAATKHENDIYVVGDSESQRIFCAKLCK